MIADNVSLQANVYNFMKTAKPCVDFVPPELLLKLRPSLHSRVQIWRPEKLIERPVQAELLANITQVARLPVEQLNKLPAKPDILSAHQLWTFLHVKLANSVSCAA